MNLKRYLFIDTDPGTDDMMAIIYLLKDLQSDVVGLSSVYGNVDIETCTRNLRLITSLILKENPYEIEIFKGTSKPIINIKESNGTHVHGSDGCGNFFSSDYYNIQKNEIDNIINRIPLSNLSAVMGLIKMSKKYCGDLVVVALGPLTNLALAQLIDPDFGQRLKEIFIMGGDLYGFKKTENLSRIDFNFSSDPEAAYVVLKEIECKKTILPLEPIYTVLIKPEISDKWLKNLDLRQDCLSQMLTSIINYHRNTKKVYKISDLMLAILIVHPDVVKEIVNANISVELYDLVNRGRINYLKHKDECKSVDIVASFCLDSIFHLLEEFI